jgi:multiple sugar transport system ATP-binding protein
VLKDGILQQCGTPRELYDHPDNVFVAGFIGSPAMNLLSVPLTEGGAKIGGRVGTEKLLPMPAAVVAAAGSGGATEVTIGFRPEDLRVTSEDEGWPIEVDVVESLGADAYVYGHVTMLDGESRDIIVRTDGRTPPMKGETMHVGIIPDHQHAFHSVTGERIVV